MNQTASIPASRPASQRENVYPSENFEFRGKTYRIYKRSAEPDASWYYQYQIGEKRFPTSLDTSAKKAAIETAKLIITAKDKGRDDELAKIRALLGGKKVDATIHYSTIGDIIAWFEKAKLFIRERSRDIYIAKLKIILKKACATDDVEKLSADVLSPATVRKYFEQAADEAAKHKDQETANRSKRTALSDLNCAKSLLAFSNVADMTEDGLTLPEIMPFHSAVKARWKKFSKGLSQRRERLPADELLKKTVDDWQQFTDRNEFIAVGLMLSCGLRKSVAAQVRGFWASTSNGEPRLNSAANTKDGTGEIYIRPIDPYWRILWQRIEREGWAPADKSDFLLQGHYTEINEDTFRRISKWMRAIGWQTSNTNHALRAYVVGLVILKYGLEAAKEFATHKRSATTEAKYAYLIKPGQRTLTPEQVPIEWAK